MDSKKTEKNGNDHGAGRERIELPFGRRTINTVLIGLGFFFLVALIGAVILLGSLLNQIITGNRNPESIQDQQAGVGTIIIRETPPVPQGGTGLEMDGREVARDVLQASVVISCYQSSRIVPDLAAYGFFINENGYILTGSAVAKGGSVIQVTLRDGRTVRAKLAGYDAKTDIAILKIEEENLATAPLGSGSLQEGERLYYIGLSEKGSLYVSEGSAGGSAWGFFDTPAGYGSGVLTAIDRRTSPHPGGVVVNWAGQVVGVRCAHAEESDVVFTLPVTEIKEAAEEIMENGLVTGRVSLGYRGIDVTTVMSEVLRVPTGVWIEALEENGALVLAGADEGDIITTFNGNAVSNSAMLEHALAELGPNEADMIVFRVGEGKTLMLSVRPLPDLGRY